MHCGIQASTQEVSQRLQMEEYSHASIELSYRHTIHFYWYYLQSLVFAGQIRFTFNTPFLFSFNI